MYERMFLLDHPLLTNLVTFTNLVLRVSLGFQTLENNKSTQPAASCFHLFSRVWKPNETLALVFEILLYLVYGRNNFVSYSEMFENL